MGIYPVEITFFITFNYSRNEFGCIVTPSICNKYDRYTITSITYNLGHPIALLGAFKIFSEMFVSNFVPKVR